MQEYKIESGIPLIPRAYKTGAAATLRLMKVGDSVVAPITTRNGWNATARSCGVKIAIRKISDTEVRVWRIE